MLRYEHIISIFSACHKKSTKNTLSPYKNKMHNIHVRGEIVLFYFSTLKLKYFANLSFQSAVYDKKHHISTGGLASTIADPRIIFKAAIEHNSAGIILVHNHPSGNSQPSQSDFQLTERLIRSGKILRIPVLDHIIFAEDDYFSFIDNKLI